MAKSYYLINIGVSRPISYGKQSPVSILNMLK